MIGKRLINTGAAAADAVFTPSENFNTVLYTGNGSTQRIGGYINRGALFNGSTSYITVEPSPVAQPDSDADFSLSMFFSTEQVPTSGFRTLISDHNPNSGSQTATLGLIIYGNSSGQHFSLQRAFSGTAYWNSTTTTVHTTLSANTWYHLAATYKSSNREAKIYLNGSLLATYTLSDSYSGFNLASGFTLGNYYNNSSYYVYNWDGKIDQFRIFNKILSSSEITTLYGETFASTTISTTDIFSDNSGVALYQLDGNANDTGGVSGKFGSAAIFNGSSSNIDLPNLGISGANTRSISAWINVNSLSSAQTILQYGSNSAEQRFGFAIDTSGKVYVEYYGRDAITSSAHITVGSWFHLAVIYNGGAIETATNTQIYVNGSAVSMSTSGTSTGSANTTDSNYAIGYDRLNTRQYFDGTIDQVRIYSDVLTSTEVGYLYNNTTASIPTDNLEAYYKLDGDARDEQQLYDGTASNVTYAYDGTASNVTYQEATKFSPDLVWIKERTNASHHALFYSVRGNQYLLSPNQTIAEIDQTANPALESFDTNGFTVDQTNTSNYYVNRSSQTYAAWCFNAGEGAAATNNDGTIASTVKANQDAGFSIVEYTANATSGATIGHGLNEELDLLIVKSTNLGQSWNVYVKDVTDTNAKYLRLNQSDGILTTVNPRFIVGNFNSDVFSVGNDNSTNGVSGTDQYIAYCFHSVDNYQKVGSYTGNGGVNHIETDFEPAWIMIKPTSVADNWLIYDNKRGKDIALFANLSNGDTPYSGRLSFASDGFVIDSSNDGWNGNNETYIYLAIAADPDTTTPTVENSFDVVTYSGSNSAQSIDTDFKPDLVWVKNRDDSRNHVLSDSIRGAENFIVSNSTGAEITNDPQITSLNDNGFSLIGNSASVNRSGYDYVAWVWKAGDHDDNLPQINTEGTIDSVVSVNAEAGFSIVKYTGTGLAVNNTIGHGLSSAPEMIILKRLNSTNPWIVYHTAMGTGKHMELNSTGGESGTGSLFGYPADVGVAPTSTVFTVGVSSSSNASSSPFIAYCFHSVTGYQKIGSYTGSGSSGKVVTTGFQPRFLMVKAAIRPSGGGSWYIFDNVRTTSNPQGQYLQANESAQELDGTSVFNIDFESNGFTVNGTNNEINQSGSTYIYLAIK